MAHTAARRAPCMRISRSVMRSTRRGSATPGLTVEVSPLLGTGPAASRGHLLTCLRVGRVTCQLWVCVLPCRALCCMMGTTLRGSAPPRLAVEASPPLGAGPAAGRRTCPRVSCVPCRMRLETGIVRSVRDALCTTDCGRESASETRASCATRSSARCLCFWALWCQPCRQHARGCMSRCMSRWRLLELTAAARLAASRRQGASRHARPHHQRASACAARRSATQPALSDGRPGRAGRCGCAAAQTTE